MPMRSVVVAMRTSIRKEVNAAAKDSIDKINIMAMKAARSQCAKALTNSITTTSAMNSADSVIKVIAALM
jgi:hypothetical protein